MEPWNCVDAKRFVTSDQGDPLGEHRALRLDTSIAYWPNQLPTVSEFRKILTLNYQIRSDLLVYNTPTPGMNIIESFRIQINTDCTTATSGIIHCKINIDESGDRFPLMETDVTDEQRKKFTVKCARGNAWFPTKISNRSFDSLCARCRIRFSCQ